MNRLQKLIGMRNGNGIMRQYKNAKIIRNLTGGVAAYDLYVGARHAMNHDAVGTMFFGGFSCFFLKLAKDSTDIMKNLRPMRDEIVARAKQIYMNK